jgi:hypothetical protein
MVSFQGHSGYPLLARIYFFGAMAGQQVNVLLIAKYLSSSNDQVLDVSFRRRQIVGDASGAVRDVHCFFQDRDFHCRLVSFGTAGGTHAGGICSDDDKFHGFLLLQRKYSSSDLVE